MSYDRKEDLSQVDAESCSLAGDLSLLDELFPSLGDGGSSSNHFTNQLAFLLNSFNSNEEDGASNGPSLFNPLQLSPPRLNEFHALATANLISQTQEAIMQEYNISDLDFEPTNNPDAENNTVAVNSESSDLSCSSSIEYSAISVREAVNDSISESKAENLNSGKIIKDCCVTNLNPHSAEGNSTVKLIDRESILIEDNHSNVSLLMKYSENNATDNDVNLNKQVSVATESDNKWNNSDFKTFEKSTEMEISQTSLIKDKEQLDNKCLKISCKENSYRTPSMGFNENHHGVKRTFEDNEISVNNPSSDNNLDYVPKQVDQKHKLIEAEPAFKINGQHSETSQLKKKLLKFEQNRESPLDANHLQNDSCTNGQSTNGRVLFMCLKCLKQFNSVDDLENHSTNHLQYVCPQPGCIRTFAHRSHLSYHRKVHEKEKSHQCSECGKLFTKAQHLDVHMRTHGDNKPFVCDVCNKCFTTTGNLKNHSRLHTGERPFACDFNGCDKRFVEMSSLKKHKVTHTGEKSYKCDICGKSFTQVSSKNYHMKRHKDVKGKQDNCVKTS